MYTQIATLTELHSLFKNESKNLTTDFLILAIPQMQRQTKMNPYLMVFKNLKK